MSETKTETLMPDIMNIPNSETFCKLALDEDEPRFGTYKPTHVVSAITYGGDAHIEFNKVSKKK